MKKISLIMASVLSVGLLAGCGATETPKTETPVAENQTPAASVSIADAKDGVYYAQQNDPEADWNYAVTVNVAGGKFTDVNWTGISKNAGPDKKAVSESGEYGMKKAGAQAEWHEQAEKVEQFLIEKQDLSAMAPNEEGKTDAISGVSIKVKDFTSLVNQALAAGPVEPGKYKDGSYKAEGTPDDKGNKTTVDLTVLNGNIVAVNWNSLDAEGKDKKTLSKEGTYAMKAAGAQAEWHEQAAKAEQALIEKQDPAAIVVDAEGKTDAISGVSIKVGEFLELTTKALEGAMK
ncbi:FMN-binding protein [Brevibacillus daliensis]|uniref:FMN-binding protein n=1 Tax=Brevibacillus daliensis TaxID=2892995 RepID=UPI001E4C7271|nr:FMN-binding protein [Brevibacillus daliensis]